MSFWLMGLSEQWRMRGLHKYLTRALCFVTIGLGL